MDLLTLTEKEFYDFYDKLLNSADRDKPWFYKEGEEGFTIIILEPPLIIRIKISKNSILSREEDRSTENINAVLQRWREEHLNYAIPFQTLGEVVE